MCNIVTQFLGYVECGSMVNATSVWQEAATPGHPDSNYPNNADCSWIITAPDQYGIALDFKEFEIESCCDHLYIGNDNFKVFCFSLCEDQRLMYSLPPTWTTCKMVFVSKVSMFQF